MLPGKLRVFNEIQVPDEQIVDLLAA